MSSGSLPLPGTRECASWVAVRHPDPACRCQPSCVLLCPTPLTRTACAQQAVRGRCGCGQGGDADARRARRRGALRRPGWVPAPRAGQPGGGRRGGSWPGPGCPGAHRPPRQPAQKPPCCRPQRSLQYSELLCGSSLGNAEQVLRRRGRARSCAPWRPLRPGCRSASPRRSSGSSTSCRWACREPVQWLRPT